MALIHVEFLFVKGCYVGLLVLLPSIFEVSFGSGFLIGLVSMVVVCSLGFLYAFVFQWLPCMLFPHGFVMNW